jgi:peptidoglycan glycosyltransferase
MFRLSRSARNSLLAVGAVLALFVGLKSDADGDAPSAHIPAGQRRSASKPKPAPVPRKDRLIGDISLQGEVDLAKQRLVDDHYETRLPDGSQAVLTLDPKWQKAAEKVLAQAKAPQASIVVMKTDGTILALAAGRYQNNSMQADARLGLSTWAPAASIFKIVTASSLLANGLPAKKEVCYHGGLRSVEPSNLIDNPKADGTCNSLEYGVAKSQNALMAKLVTKFLKRAELRATANAFGFGKAPEFALKAQSPTLKLPTESLAFARVAAGFWQSRVSALSGALIANTIASGGLSVTPRIVSEVRERGRTIPVVSTEPERVLEEKIAKTVANMMSATVRYGTAKKAFRDGRGRPYMKDTAIAGKTGSLSRTSPEYLGYSWFVGFAPVEDPEVVISVLLGNPAKWHLKAHTAARLVLDSHF